MMLATLEWLVEGQLCHAGLPSVFDEAALRDYDNRLIQWLDNAPGKVHIIADFRGVKSLPPLRTLVGLRHPYHARLGYGITIGLTQNAVARFLITMGGQVMGMHHRDFDTLNQARAFLSQMEGI
jgi:hypothetical protein